MSKLNFAFATQDAMVGMIKGHAEELEHRAEILTDALTLAMLEIQQLTGETTMDFSKLDIASCKSSKGVLIAFSQKLGHGRVALIPADREVYGEGGFEEDFDAQFEAFLEDNKEELAKKFEKAKEILQAHFEAKHETEQ